MINNKGILIFESDDYSQVALDTYSDIGPVWRMGIDQFDPHEVGCLVVRLAHYVDCDFLEPFPNLLALATPTTGVTHLDIQVCERKGIRVFTLRDCMPKLQNITSTAEHALCLMLSLLRRLPQAHFSTVEQGEWNRDEFCSRQLSSLRLGIVGLGRIGRWMARYAKAMGMEVVANDPYIPPEVFASEGVLSISLEDLCHSSDIISIHADLRADNFSLLDSSKLSLLSSNAYLINTARGELVDEEVLAQMVRNSRLAGVAVDVLRSEYDLQEREVSPLLRAAKDGFNVIVTPHIGGCTSDAMRQTEVYLAEAVVTALRDES